MSQPPALHGLHHVTAVTADAPRNLAFYTGVLGLRLVKTTVNQDDTSAYHLFYADAQGTPGTELTFFEWPHVPPAYPGAGVATETALRVAGGRPALEQWRHHLATHGDLPGEIETQPGATLPSLAFTDPEGQLLRLVAEDAATLSPSARHPWTGSPLPPEISVFGLSAVTLTVRDPAATAAFLTETLGFRQPSTDPTLYETGPGGPNTQLRLLASTVPASQGAGGVHHVAWTVADRAEQQIWAAHLTAHRVPHSGEVDRFYFQSLYFRIPGGILFELATRGPGFTADGEPLDHLGERLSLPPFLENQRARIERGLRPLTQPSSSRSGVA